MFPLAALTFDPADPGTNKDRPRNINHHILNRPVMTSIVLSGFFMAIIGYGTFVFTYRYHGYPIA
jgi:magnesium-transporting ATPase (P-type)